MKKKFTLKGKIFPIIGVTILTIYTISFLIPLLWAVLTSFKDVESIVTNPIGLPKVWYYQNYIDIFEILTYTVYAPTGKIKYYMPAMFLNSLVYALGNGFLHTLVPCVVAYVVAKYKYKFSDFIYSLVIITMLLPIVGSMPAQLKVLRMLNLYDTLGGIFIMRFSFLGINFLMFYGGFKSISWEYAEAGFIDGASHFKVMFSLMLPLVKPMILAVFMLSFITYWNEYTIPMVMLPSLPTISLGVHMFSFSNEASTPLRMTGCIMVCIPILIAFLLFKNKLMGNVAVGGIKG